MRAALKEPWWTKLLFVAAFLAAGAASFFATLPLANWIKTSDSNLLVNFLTQAILVAPVGVVLFVLEERVIWRLLGQNAFATVHPFSLGACVGYVAHFAY